MTTRDLIVIGASAGGVEALTRLCSLLPRDFGAAVLITLHVTPDAPSRLPHILSRVSRLPVWHAKNGEHLQNGHIFIAPPNRHLYLKDHHLYLSSGPRVNGARPAIDVLFQSAALAFGSGVIGIVLSGMLGDGSDGLQAIKKAGGIALVQKPEEAAFASMPLNAIQKVAVDYVLPIDQLVEKVRELAGQPVMSRQMESGEVLMVQGKNTEFVNDLSADRARFEKDDDDSPRSLLVCPECGGVLWEKKESGIAQYRCQIGHAFSEESLVTLQSNQLENALWSAVRALEERSMLAARLANRMRQRKATRSEQQFLLVAREADDTMKIIRKILLDGSLLNAITAQDAYTGEGTLDQKDDVL